MAEVEQIKEFMYLAEEEYNSETVAEGGSVNVEDETDSEEDDDDDEKWFAEEEVDDDEGFSRS